MRRNASLNAFLCTLCVVALCLIVPLAQAASKTQAGNCVSGVQSFPTIQLAVDVVGNPGTVYVCPGTYPEQVRIPPSTLTLTGVDTGTGATATVVPPSGGMVQNGTDIFGNPMAAQIFVYGPGANVTISNLTVDANPAGGNANNLPGTPELFGIYYQNASGKITNNVVRNQYYTNFATYGGDQSGLAINVEATSNPGTVTISGNSVRSYQKNGITATGNANGTSPAGPAVTITSNYVVGLGATSLNWPTSGAGENGIQVGFGATGTVTSNSVLDNIWGQAVSGQPTNGASGILIYASAGVSVENNTVGSAQFGIATDTDSGQYGLCGTNVSCGVADNATITGNKLVGTQLFDAIDVCSNTNTVEKNTIYGSAESGIHLDTNAANYCGDSFPDGTTTGNNNRVSGNTINEACAAILTGTGSGNTVTPGTTIYNVVNTTLAGDVCPAATGGGGSAVRQGASVKHQSFHTSPYAPMKR